MAESKKWIEFSFDIHQRYPLNLPVSEPGPWLIPIDPGYHISDKPRIDRPRSEARRRAQERDEKKKEMRGKRHSPQFRVSLRMRLAIRQIMKRLKREGLIK